MKQLLLLLCFFPQTLFAQLKKLTAETTVQGVTVFTSGAQILRTASVAVAPGRSQVVFPGLSNQLQQQSLQLKADAAITLLSVQAAPDFFTKRQVEQEEKTLLERGYTLKDKIEADTKLLDVYKAEEAMLIKNQAIGGSAGVKATDLKEALDLQRQRLTEVYQKQLDLQKRIAVQQQELQTVYAQTTEIGKKKDSVNYVVTALVESKEARTVKFQLLYTVKDAGWYPTYDVRVSEVAKPLELLLNANVFQRSGETWKDVALQISTGSPGDNATPPQLQTWMLGFYDPSIAWMQGQAVQPGVATGRIVNSRNEPLAGASVNVKGSLIATVTDANGFFKLQGLRQNSIVVFSYVGYGSKEIALKPGYVTVILDEATSALSEVVVTGLGVDGYAAGATVSEPQRRKERIEMVSVATQYQPTAVVYKIEEKYTLETDGKTTTIGIKQHDIDALYEYYAVPKLDPAAYLTAKITDWQTYDLLSGEANLYFEGTSLGKTYIDLSAAGDTLMLSLGKDNAVRVIRTLAKEFSSKKLIGANRTDTRHYEIVVRNTKKAPVSLVVTDQSPVSTTKEIDVTEIKAPDAEVDKETGLITWNLTVLPAQEKKLQLRYQVKYPKEKRLVLE